MLRQLGPPGASGYVPPSVAFLSPFSPLFSSSAYDRHHRRQRQRSLAICARSAAADESRKSIFGSEQQLNGPQKFLEDLPASARYVTCGAIVAAALAAGYVVGARAKGTSAAALGGALALGAAGGATAFALNASAPHVAAVHLHNALVSYGDPKSITRDDIDSILQKFGVSRQNERIVSELRNLYDRFVTGIIPPGNEELKGDEADEIIRFKDALGLDDPEAASVHIEIGRRISRQRLETGDRETAIEERRSFQKLVYVSTLVFGEAAKFLLPWKRVFKVTDAQVDVAVRDNAQRLFLARLESLGSDVTLQQLVELREVQLKFKLVDEVAADLFRAHFRKHVEQYISSAIQALKARSRVRDTKTVVLELEKVLDYSASLSSLAEKAKTSTTIPGLGPVSLLGGEYDTDRHIDDLKQLYSTYLTDALSIGRLEVDKVSALSQLKNIFGLGNRQADSIMQEVTHHHCTGKITSLYWQDHEALARKDPARKRSDAATRGVPIDRTLHKGAKKPYPSRQNPPEGRICGTAVLQGRRMSQEDRVACIPDIRLQFFDDEQAHLVSLLAVFDGHFGHDASELAATSIYPRFLYHLYSIIGELASTACINYVDACPTKITGEGINGRKSEPIHGNSFSIYACSEKRANFSGLLLPEECHGRKATAMQDLLSITNAAGFSPATTTVWHTAFSHWSDVDVEDQFHEQEWSKMDLQSVRSWAVSGKMESSLLRTILKQALQNAMFEIDRVFSTEAEKKGSGAGSTACVMLHAEEYLLIANLGDSKAFMCSSATSCSSHVQLDECQENLRVCKRKRKRRTSGQGPSASLEGDTSLCSQELTSDHRPDRDDERKRVVEAGGFIENTGGVPRVNGQLAVTCSIGDVALKRFGIIAQPEFTGWHRIAENDTLLVVASDGVFEKMTVQDVCNILYVVSCDRSLSAAIGHVIRRQGQAIPLLPNEEFKTSQADKNVVAAEAVSLAGSINQQQHAPEVAETESSHPNTFETSSSLQLKQLAVHAQASKEVHQQMAEAVVDAAFLSGSMDNVAAVVLPVVSLHHLSSDKCSELQSRSTYKTRNVHGSGELLDAKGIASTSAEQEHKETGEKVTTQCYQLMKTLPRQVLLPLLPVSTTMETNLPEKREVIYQAATTHNSHIHASRKAPLVRQNEGRSKFELDVYREHLVCTSRQAVLEPHNEVCLRPEGLSAFLSLIGSVPLDYLSLPASDRDSILGGYHDSSVLPPYMVHHNRYMLQQKFAKGGFGEIWLGVKRLCVPEGGELSTFNMLQPEKQGNRSDGIWGDNFDTPNHDNEETYIFKRIRVEKGSKAYLSGYRERHFGEIFLNSSLELLTTSRQGRSTEDLHFLAASGSVAKRCRCCINGEQTSAEEVVNCGGSRHQHSPDRVTDSVPTRNHANLGDEGLKHIARYIEAIERPALQELWLVFRNEGQSLSKLLYVADGASSQSTGRSNMAGGFKVLRPSPWWKWLKSTEAGRKEMRNLLRQLLLAVHACSTRNITHRDIKPENMIVKSINLANQLPNGEWPSNLTMRIIDFGSAIDPFTLRHLYDSSGPSQDEQTAEYAPPEALLGKHWLQFHADKAQVYDLWSVGVVMLELVLGTPHVFQISARTRALLDQRLDGWDTTAKETAYKLRAFMELCILPQGVRPHRHHRQRDKTWDHSDEARLASFECSEAAFTQHIKQRDPLGMGMPDMSALRLVRRLLEWYPEDRISAFEALQHPYFNSGDRFP